LALAGAGLKFCASKTGAVWLHNTMTATAIIDLQNIRLFIVTTSGRLHAPSTASTPIGGHLPQLNTSVAVVWRGMFLKSALR
jgi:hypothetical protein